MTRKLKLDQFEVRSFITEPQNAQGVKGGITGTVCEGDTTPHVCPSGLPICPNFTYEINCTQNCTG